MHANAKTRVAKIAKAIDAITKTANGRKCKQMDANAKEYALERSKTRNQQQASLSECPQKASEAPRRRFNVLNG